MGPQELALLIKQLQHRVEQQRQDVECGQKRSQMLLTVPKIVFQVVALGLEGVITAYDAGMGEGQNSCER